MVRLPDDLKSALVLSSAFAIAAAASVPLLLPALPAEARSLPLPLPLFCGLLAIQLAIVYGLLGWAGLRLARSRGLEPAPVLTALWTAQATRSARPGFSLGVGLGCGVLLVAAVSMIQRFLPSTLPRILHPPGITAALVASTAGSFGEEILFRLFLLSLLLRVLPQGRTGTATAVVVSALFFAVAHVPAFVFLFGGWKEVPPASWFWLIALNGLCGIALGIVFLRCGIGAAVLAHLTTDTVWHVAAQLIRS